MYSQCYIYMWVLSLGDSTYEHSQVQIGMAAAGRQLPHAVRRLGPFRCGGKKPPNPEHLCWPNRAAEIEGLPQNDLQTHRRRSDLWGLAFGVANIRFTGNCFPSRTGEIELYWSFDLSTGGLGGVSTETQYMLHGSR